MGWGDRFANGAKVVGRHAIHHGRNAAKYVYNNRNEILDTTQALSDFVPGGRQISRQIDTGRQIHSAVTGR
jgi:hypothetical protein